MRRPSQDNATLPVIFNDYMNCLMGDPTTESQPAAADRRPRPRRARSTSCIDAGWYADERGWWDTRRRTGSHPPPGSRAAWIEALRPIRDARAWSPASGWSRRWSASAARWPRRCRTTRSSPARERGCVEHGRYQLDYAHPAVREHLDEVVDRLVGDSASATSSSTTTSTPARHRRARGEPWRGPARAQPRASCDWLDGVLDRHPGLVLENCASGGMRMDYALLSRLQLQSTSDQQDHHHLRRHRGRRPEPR